MGVVPEIQRRAARKLLGDTHLTPLGGGSVIRQGGSLYLRVPPRQADAWAIEEGDEMFLFSADVEGALVAKSADQIEDQFGAESAADA